MVRSLLFGIRFLTILPLGQQQRVEGRQLGAATRYFPLAGLLIGLIVALAAAVFGWLMAGAGAAALTVAVWVVITGALHLDGLADTVDGFYAGRRPDEVLEIMRDPHIGLMGVVAIVLALVLKFAGVVSLPESGRLLPLVVLPVAGRWSMVLLLGGATYVRPQGVGRDLADEMNAADVRLAAVITLVLALLCLGWKLGIVFFVLVWAFTWVLQLFLVRRIGGITGDCCGAAGELVELFGLFLILLART